MHAFGMQAFVDAASVTATPVRGCLIVSVPAELSPGVFEALRERTLAGLQRGACRAVVFDLSAVAIMDGEDFGQLRRLVAATRLLGVRPLIVGFQAGVVIHLMESGVDTVGLEVARDLEEALDRTRATASEAVDESWDEAGLDDQPGDGDGTPAGRVQPLADPVRASSSIPSSAAKAITTPWR